MSKKIISKDNYDMDGRLISKSTYLVDEESEVTPEVTNGYQKLFNYMKNEHDVTLLVTDMDEIIRIVHGMQPTKTEPSRLEVAAMEEETLKVQIEELNKALRIHDVSGQVCVHCGKGREMHTVHSAMCLDRMKHFEKTLR